MALSGTTIWEVESGASDTLNGGAFDPGQTAGMLTDGAATSATGTAPVFSSASYNFVSGDIGAWVYIAAGTNWTPGWYKIASVAANAATLNATIGQAVLAGLFPSTVAGCATSASPTAATWTIDYSQQSAAQFAYTDLASAGTGLTVSSVAKPFGKQQVGNCIVITGGTNFNLGRYVIASVGGGLVATVVGPTNITTGVGVTGTGGLGGALASPGQAGVGAVTSNVLSIKTATYSLTSASTNISGGCVSWVTSGLIFGYGSIRGDLGTMPVLQASGISTATLLATGSTSSTVNIAVDGASLTSIKGVTLGSGLAYQVKSSNCTNVGIGATASSFLMRCIVTNATGGAGGFASGGSGYFECESFSNTVAGFSQTGSATYVSCLSYNNSGASSDGFTGLSNNTVYRNCTAYGNGRDGFRSVASGIAVSNCLAEANTGLGFNVTGSGSILTHCGTFNNTGGTFGALGSHSYSLSPVINTTGSFFVNAAGSNFALNNTANQGALARAAGTPGVFPSGNTTGFLDIGGAQHQDPASAGMLFIPNLEAT